MIPFSVVFRLLAELLAMSTEDLATVSCDPLGASLLQSWNLDHGVLMGVLCCSLGSKCMLELFAQNFA